jgi:RNase P subunit RPR2
MSKPSPIPSIQCEKCHKPMSLHSTQDVKLFEGERRMLVFPCEFCQRLSAIPAESAKQSA